MSKKEDELWALGGILAIYFIIQSGADFWENLFGTSSGDRIVPMPDFTKPEYEPKEIEITPQLTPSNFGDMLAALTRAWKVVTGDAPPRHAAAMMMAHSALETGQWRHMYEWNPTNITTSKKRGFYRLPNDETHKYAPYPDAQTGWQAYLALLSKRYPKAFGAMLSDTPALVAALLKEGGFYEADQTEYAKTLTALFGQFLPKVPGPVT